MTSIDHIARETEKTRAELATTLAELRERLSPLRLRQGAARAIEESSPARFATSLKRDASNSAFPIAMLAAGALRVVSNNKCANGARSAPGSLQSLVELGGALKKAASTLAGSTVVAARSARAGSTAAFQSVRTTGSALADAPSAVAEAGNRLGHTAKKVVDGVQVKSAAALRASAEMATRTSRSIRAAGVIASKDPVFIAGVGIAAAGIAAVVLGISRQNQKSEAAKSLVDAAENEAVAPQHASPDRSVSDYKRDMTGAAEPVAPELVG